MGSRTTYLVDKTSLASVAIVLFGLSQFAACLRIAVLGFNGDYSFSKDFLSDLGRTTNITAPYFNNSTMLLGACLVFFFGNIARHDSRRILGIAGIVSGIGLTGIGLTPLDKHFYEHHLFLALWLLPMFVMIASSMSMFGGSNRILVTATSVVLFCGIVLYIASAGSSAAPFHQKVVVILGICWLLLVCYHSTFAVVTEFVSRSSIGKDAATQDYIKQIEQNGLYSPNGRRTGSSFARQDE